MGSVSADGGRGAQEADEGRTEPSAAEISTKITGNKIDNGGVIDGGPVGDAE